MYRNYLRDSVLAVGLLPDQTYLPLVMRNQTTP